MEPEQALARKKSSAVEAIQIPTVPPPDLSAKKVLLLGAGESGSFVFVFCVLSPSQMDFFFRSREVNDIQTSVSALWSVFFVVCLQQMRLMMSLSLSLFSFRQRLLTR